MKKLRLKAVDLGVTGILSREELKNVLGGSATVAEDSLGGRCVDHRFCSVYQQGDGGCLTMGTGQCRCVLYRNGAPSESVPDSYCLNTPM